MSAKSSAKNNSKNNTTTTASETKEQKSSENGGNNESKSDDYNTRGIPPAKFIKNPYTEVAYRGIKFVEKYLKDIDNALGKYQLMERSLVKQKLTKIDQLNELKKNIEVTEYLKNKNNIDLHFEVADQLYAEAEINDTKTVAIWLGAGVMLEFSIDEGISFLETRVNEVQNKVNELQNDIDFCRKQINICEVNKSRVYNANIKVKRVKESLKG
mmetsp:Transcript_63682/g.77893  ORF Transcript_63682/g.77893 Transcript_63682/m.77893 type:complete len:213 (-) Transcript_63682:58-696(-)